MKKHVALLVIANVRTCEACISDAGGTCGDPCPCPADGQSAIDHAAAGDCPRRKFGRVPGAKKRREEWGPALWRELHTKTDADAAYVKSVTRRLPCGECRRGWSWFVKEYPPVFGDGWWEWTWRAHNYVNTKLGKPTMTLDDARRRWPGAW